MSGANIDSLTVSPIDLGPVESDDLIRVNFQADGVPIPEGYQADTGLAYSDDRGYGWIDQNDVGTEAPTPLDISQGGRDRDATGYDQRLDTLLHFQKTPAAWEYALPNGDYSVTLSAGDNTYSDSEHVVNVEGVNLLPSFTPDNTQKFALATGTVTVNDGKLTVDAIGGTNAKINYIDIQPTSKAASQVSGGAPVNRATDVALDEAITLDVTTPGTSNGVDGDTLSDETVQLYRTRDASLVPGLANTTGGNDAIVFQPSAPLEANTQYTFRVTEGVQDLFGNGFQPFSTNFSTGADENTPSPNPPTGGPDPEDISFDRSTVASGSLLSSLEMSPDGSQLYGTSLAGQLYRWDIDSDGGLSNQQTFNGLDGRIIIGIAFDPTAPNTLWLSHNGQSSDDFTGTVSKLTLADGNELDATVEDYVTGLPRSTGDHLTNSLEFGPDGGLYLTQGSNSAMGAPDSRWGLRPERLLSASVLRIDPTLSPPSGGFNVQTEDYEGTSGSYDPFAPDAPVTIYGQGLRNAYDLVWHSNGSLYVPTNGSAAGGNTPDDPNQAGDQSLNGVSTQNDYLFKVEQGGYYGHPNPEQGNYILNGGNPTNGADPAEVSEYSVGTQPDPEYGGFAHDFGRNRSPNGVIEYQSDVFGDALQGQLLVTEYSGGDDILALQLGANGDVVNSSQIASGFSDPLDLVEHSATGNLYVLESGSDSQIELLSTT